ncbi:MAG: hypothetical protein RI894_984 [Bacteroidota bacterium]|jgi:hypothetical protein
MKKIIIILVAFAALTTAQAQTSIGFRAGVNFGNRDITPKTITSSGSGTATEPGIVGLSLAVPFQFKLSDKFAVQPELCFLQKGYSEYYVNGSDYIRNSLTMSYLELPILGKLIFGGDKFNCGILLGPSFGYALGGRTTLDYKLNGTSKTIEENMNFTTNYKNINRFDMGFIIGAAPSYAISDAGSLFLDVRYQFGLSDIVNDTPDNTKAFNRGLGLSIGYLHAFGGK